MADWCSDPNFAWRITEYLDADDRNRLRRNDRCGAAAVPTLVDVCLIVRGVLSGAHLGNGGVQKNRRAIGWAQILTRIAHAARIRLRESGPRLLFQGFKLQPSALRSCALQSRELQSHDLFDGNHVRAARSDHQ
jgi:hypothetical protein